MHSLDDPMLQAQWYAVAWSREVVAGGTLGRRVLGRDVVLWRAADPSADGVHGWLDLCIHRGAKLSLGTVRATDGHAECLVCPYHGWRYDGAAQCVAIPAQPGVAPPAKARATAFRVRERYGVVWICLGNGEANLPEFALAEDAAFRAVLAGPYRFRALGPRLIENLLDVAHLGIVHDGLLGNAASAEIGDYEVTAGARGPEAREIRLFQPDPDGTGRGAEVAYHYQVQGPLTAGFVKSHGAQRFGILAQAMPVDGETCEMRMVMAMNYGHEIPADELIAFQDRVVEQDRAIVESQRPELLPLDLQAELHLRSDGLAVAYRKWLRQTGFRYGVA